MSLNSEQAKMAAEKRWGEKPVRMCEVCGREHRCVKVWVEEGGTEEAVRTLVGLFEESLRRVVIHELRKEEQEKKGDSDVDGV